MSKKDSNILEIKLERVLKKRHLSDFNRDLKPIANHPVSVSQLWSLPLDIQTAEYSISQSFGKMYVGESFTSSLKVTNISQSILERVIISCSLKYTNAKSLPVLFQAELQKLFPDSSNRFAFTLNVDVSDVYYLTLQAHFSVKEITEPITVSKVFKFEAKLPLEFQHKVIKADEGFIVQNRIINQSIYTISVDSVEFICSSSFKAIPYTSSPGSYVFSPGEIRSFLHHLIESAPMPGNSELGRVLATWHNTTGDIGNIPSAPINHNYRYDKTLKISIENRPKYFILEEPTCFNLKILNLTTNFVMKDVMIEMSEKFMNNFIINPLAPTFFNKIQPQESVSLLCSGFPKIPGIHKIEGIKVYTGKKPLEFESFSICVKSN